MLRTKIQKMIAVCCLLSVVVTNASAQKNQSFYFTDAQPLGTDVLAEFPAELIGKFDGPDTTTRLIITKEAVKSRFFILFTTTLDKVNGREDIYLENGEIHGLSESRSYPYTMGHDTIYFYYPNEVSIFDLDDGVLMKVNKDLWAMNIREDNGLYTCVLLELDGDSLYMRSFVAEDAWAAVEEIKYKDKKVKGERAYVAEPDDGEFYDLLDGFTDTESYIKQIVE